MLSAYRQNTAPPPPTHFQQAVQMLWEAVLPGTTSGRQNNRSHTAHPLVDWPALGSSPHRQPASHTHSHRHATPPRRTTTCASTARTPLRPFHEQTGQERNIGKPRARGRHPTRHRTFRPPSGLAPTTKEEMRQYLHTISSLFQAAIRGSQDYHHHNHPNHAPTKKGN